ncbi:MAG: MFS transporter [Clostridia bacterium]|nr:MFS transporter [Clostridia bacterium]
MKQTEKKTFYGIVFLLASVYFVSYITRLNYNTIIIEIIDVLNLSKAAASLPLTGMAISYGAGQLISGYAGDKIQPKRIVGIGLAVTILMNILIPFSRSSLQMTVIWSINGMAQAFIWPPIVKLMNELFDNESYNKACVAVTSSGHLGHILVYIAAPVLINLGGWKTVFYSSAVAGIIMLGVWLLKCPMISMDVKNKESKDVKTTSFPWSFMLIAILIAIVLQGMLRDGITAWMPSLVSETFGLGNNISILTGVILPVFAIISISVVSGIKRRFVENELKLTTILFGIAAILAATLAVFREINPILTIILVGLLVSCMNGTNLLLIGFVPRNYAKLGIVSLVSGVLNSCTYLGAAISTYGIAVVSDRFGWTATIFLWSATALCGSILCYLNIKKWETFTG